jgi:NAD(P)-dependent dehydrogenase (short-subunit alcohol dehydrogenase family)
MGIVFITGSTDGLGRAAAQSLLDNGHKVVLHARSTDWAQILAELALRSAGIVIGDLRSAAETRSIADQVNAIGRMDAVIHNAGVYAERSRGSTPEGHAGTLAVNTLAPYMLTVLIERPAEAKRPRNFRLIRCSLKQSLGCAQVRPWLRCRSEPEFPWQPLLKRPSTNALAY